MNTPAEGVRHLVDAVVYREKTGKLPHALEGEAPFLTISRQTGAGGHTLALAVVEQLKKEPESLLLQSWQIADQEICHRVAEDTAVKVSVESLLSAEYHSEIEDILKELLLGYSSQDAVMRRMFHLIRNLVTFGRVIVVGRGGACLTRDLPLGIHIRLVAPLSSRIRRMMTLMRLDEKKAKELIFEQDKAREKLVKVYFGKNIEDPLLYDAVWNTETVSMETVARAVVVMIKEKFLQAGFRDAAQSRKDCCGIR